MTSLVLQPVRLFGNLKTVPTPAPIPDATRYVALKTGDGLAYEFPPGALASAHYLVADFLVEGIHLVVFALQLQEGETGPCFRLHFSGLNECSARLRMPMEATNQNRWMYPREAAWLKPCCYGDKVDLTRVDRMTLAVIAKDDQPASWSITPFTATADTPPRLTTPILPKGNLLDEFGQNALHNWPGKSLSRDEISARLHNQLRQASAQTWPTDFSRWGGWKEVKFEATGFFRTHHDGNRWWLVAPDGHAFWSTGLDCVRPIIESAIEGLEPALAQMPAKISKTTLGQKSANFLGENLAQAFGDEQWLSRWAEIAPSLLNKWGFNTVGNWSDWEMASRACLPYVRPLSLKWSRTPMVYRDFPDVFAPEFDSDIAEFARQLEITKTDPAFIGYFMMNEPQWGFAKESPAAGMLMLGNESRTRLALADFLRARYADTAALSRAWETPITFEQISTGPWNQPLTGRSRDDLEAFSEIMVEKLFGKMSDACRVVDPCHLNLGIRYYTVPPWWAVRGMSRFDVFSVNCYDERVNPAFAKVTAMLNVPVMVGEWHFGALDVGLPGSGIGHVATQDDRGRAYRVYLEDAASQPWCVGVHYFTMYDESAIGRFDGENWNIGFMDVAHRGYEALERSARLSHESLYRIASGRATPFRDAPIYLPKLFL